MARLLLSLLVALALAPAAHAATVSRGNGTVTFAAAPGEANDVTIAVAGGVITVHDAGAPVTAGKGCAQADAATATCSAGDRPDALVQLGDGDDRAAIARAPRFFPLTEAGDGDDVVTSPGLMEGGAGDDALTGTAGEEGMSGGAGADVLRGLGGDDSLAGDSEPQNGSPGVAEGDDILDGGAGRDAVVYAARQTHVEIDLGSGTGGAAGEHDTLISIEDAFGGAAADRIWGTSGDNKLSGGGGRDEILGFGGDDEIDGGRHINAGPGDDFLVFPRGDDYTCGAGVDAVAAPPRDRLLPTTCERVAFDPTLSTTAIPGRTGAGLRFGLRSTCRCAVHGRLEVRRKGRLLARGEIDLRPARRGRTRRATALLRFTPAGRHVLRRSRRVAVTFREPRFATTRWTTLVRAEHESGPGPQQPPPQFPRDPIPA